jgi:hypothetical protein
MSTCTLAGNENLGNGHHGIAIVIVTPYSKPITMQSPALLTRHCAARVLIMTSAWRNATALIRQSTQDKHQDCCAKNAFAIAKARMYLTWGKAPEAGVQGHAD